VQVLRLAEGLDDELQDGGMRNGHQADNETKNGERQNAQAVAAAIQIAGGADFKERGKLPMAL
jgi:hypothetical protein